MKYELDCEHSRTEIWEPHLAGARKCLDCNMVYNPNHTPSWFYEEPPPIRCWMPRQYLIQLVKEKDFKFDKEKWVRVDVQYPGATAREAGEK